MQRLLYVSAHNPYPPLSGGQVDTWNRLVALKQLGVVVDLILTVKRPLEASFQEALSAVSDRLFVVERSSPAVSFFSKQPVQVSTRRRLRSLDLNGFRYDLVVLDNEFAGEILRNTTLNAGASAVRVQNDETAYQLRLAAAERHLLRKIYFWLEACKMARFVPRLWKQVDALWFISSDELAQHQLANEKIEESLIGRFLPAGIDLGRLAQPILTSKKVLFVGTLCVILNQEAIRWYLHQVHPQLLDETDYEFIVAGSTLGRDLTDFLGELDAHTRVRYECDVHDLDALFQQSAVFVSPMRSGAGVKLKTVEAALRGLPLVSTSVGAEGSGLLDQVHCRIEDDATRFAEAVRELLGGSALALRLRDQASAHIVRYYDQLESLRETLDELQKQPEHAYCQ